MRRYHPLKESQTARVWHHTSAESALSIDESENSEITYTEQGSLVKFIKDGDIIGYMDYNKCYPDNIISEFSDSVEDFRPSSLNRLDFERPVVNIEDIWMDKRYRGRGLFVSMLKKAIAFLKHKTNQVVLRAFPDNEFPLNKLVDIYESVGFRPCQYTESDGVVMMLEF